MSPWPAHLKFNSSVQRWIETSVPQYLWVILLPAKPTEVLIKLNDCTCSRIHMASSEILKFLSNSKCTQILKVNFALKIKPVWFTAGIDTLKSYKYLQNLLLNPKKLFINNIWFSNCNYICKIFCKILYKVFFLSI